MIVRINILIAILLLSINFCYAQDKKASLNLNDTIVLTNRSDSIVAFAKQQLGIPYKYAGSSPETGFDCSGFVSYVFSEFGYKLPRSSKYYGTVGTKVLPDSCKKGDIILFAGYNPQKNPIGHVGIIISNENGDIHFIHSASSRNRGIVISHYNSIDYYTSRFVDIRRIIK